MALFDLGKRTSVYKHSVQAPTSEPVQVSILLPSTHLLLARREGGLHYALGSIHTQSPPSITSAKIIQLNILPLDGSDGNTRQFYFRLYSMLYNN